MNNGMPDVGAPTTPPPVTLSHTSTQQWQSFEIRMRHRRAARCVIRAEVALEAGFEEDARTALDEARRLNAESPDIDTMRAAVVARLAATAAERRVRQRMRAARVTAAALLLLTVGGGAFWASRSTPASEVPRAVQIETRSVVAVPATSEQEAPALSGETPAPITEPAAPSATATTGTGDGRVTRDDVPAVAAARAPEPRLEKRVPESTPAPRPAADREPVDIGPPVKVEPAVLRLAPAPSLPDRLTPPLAPPPLTAPVNGLVETLPTANVPTETREALAEAPPPAEEPRVRAVLARYESAYSGLDASAAQAVWPGVDGRSLARAFEGLESQRVSLGRCSVAVEGATARASCTGNVTWTPKVGSGNQTQARQWRFELGQANGGWRITRAEVK
jgi:hypothetical protein